MKLKPFTLSMLIILVTSATSHAGHGYFTEVFRNIGYFYGDGYHAQRYCLPESNSCNSCSQMQQPIMQQPMMPNPMMAPAHSQWAPPQFQPVSNPVGYPVSPTYQPWYPPHSRGYGQPVAAPVAIPNRTPVGHW